MFTEPGDWALTVAVASSLFLIVVVLHGVRRLGASPLEKLKINPALATGPFIQITNDVVGLLIYVGMAVWSLKLLPDVMAKKIAETPLMTQYAEMKKKHPDAVLLFRVGDFYETFRKTQ